MDPTHRVTSLGRPIDLGYRTNRLVVILTAVAAAVAAVVALAGSASLAGAAWEGLVWGGTVFLTWALARELDPDAERAAFAAVAAALVWVWVMPTPSFLFAVSVLVMLRLVNRTAGPQARLLDSLIVLGLVTWTAFALSAWTLAAAGAVIFLADRRLAPGGPKRHAVFGVSALAIALGVGLVSGGWTGPTPTGAVLWVVIACAILFAGRTIGMKSIRSRSDTSGDLRSASGEAPSTNGETLSLARVRVGMLVALGLCVASVVLGRPSVGDAGLLWASLGALGVAGLGRPTGPAGRRR